VAPSSVLSVYYDKICIKFASHHLLLYVVYMCQKSLNFIYAFKCYHQNVSGFTLAGPPCRSNRLGVGRCPNKFRICWSPAPWNKGVADTLKHVSHLCCNTKCDHFRSNYRAYDYERLLRKAARKIVSWRSVFQVTRGHWNWFGSIGYL